MNKGSIGLLAMILSCSGALMAQDTVRYTGQVRSNVDYHHGQLVAAVGVHNIQTMRAFRTGSDVPSWTYNHAPMMAYWKGRYWVSYLSNPVGEHVPPGRTLLQSSVDGYIWTDPVVAFPPYKIPDGHVKPGRKDSARNAFAVMHQRIGFHTSASGRLFVLGFYGIVLGAKDDPNDGNGIGRVIREVKPDGEMGNIYFLRYNKGFGAHNTSYPFYQTSKDKDFIAACESFLSDPLQMMQTVEEADRDDPLIPLRRDYKAFSHYRLNDGSVVGLWKHALTSMSADGGKTWQYGPLRAPGFVNANAKIWGQRTSDGKFATVYNPAEFRWPLALSVSTNGLVYTNLLLVNGEITSMRYGGAYKSYGPQYVRGIQPGDGVPADGNMWVTYSMNKEDIWVSRIPVPIHDRVDAHVDDRFASSNASILFNQWNIFSPLWCRVGIDRIGDSTALVLRDADPFDHAKADRIFPSSGRVRMELSLTADQTDHGTLEIELTDVHGMPTLRLILDSTGKILTKQGYRNKSVGSYVKGRRINIDLTLDAASRFYTLSIDGGKSSNNLCFQPVAEVTRLVLRTGAVRRFPDADTPTDQDYDLPGSENKYKEARYLIHSFRTSVPE